MIGFTGGRPGSVITCDEDTVENTGYCVGHGFEFVPGMMQAIQFKMTLEILEKLNAEDS
jgi:hypothetical protein